MGHLDQGVWVSERAFSINKRGAFDRPVSAFREQISCSHSIYQPKKNRYHLYVSYACPWAHRTLIMRQLKGLETFISVSVVKPDMLDHGWEFGDDVAHSSNDHIHGYEYLYRVYQHADPKCTARVTVPVLYDTKTETIVNNESSEILRIFNSEFNHLTGNMLDFYPKAHQLDIDTINERIYHDINNGVYKVGFAQQQKAYDDAVKVLFNTLDFLENHFKTNDYLIGDELTEADIRLIPTLLRFDCVYHTHFKCNLRQLRSYTHLYAYIKKLYDFPAIKQTTFFDHIIRHYYYSHSMINPFQIIPVCPDPLV